MKDKLFVQKEHMWKQTIILEPAFHDPDYDVGDDFPKKTHDKENERCGTQILQRT